MSPGCARVMSTSQARQSACSPPSTCCRICASCSCKTPTATCKELRAASTHAATCHTLSAKPRKSSLCIPLAPQPSPPPLAAAVCEAIPLSPELLLGPLSAAPLPAVGSWRTDPPASRKLAQGTLISLLAPSQATCGAIASASRCGVGCGRGWVPWPATPRGSVSVHSFFPCRPHPPAS